MNPKNVFQVGKENENANNSTPILQLFYVTDCDWIFVIFT